MARYPTRIFADLLPQHQPKPLLPATPVERVFKRMDREQLDALPVVARSGEFLGAVTRTSVLKALLNRERQLLEETRRLQRQVGEDHRRLAASQERLQELHSAANSLLGLFAVDFLRPDLLKRGIDALTKLVRARYGVVSILDDDGKIVEFIHAGITPEEAQRIGRLPEGRGLLGVDIPETEMLSVDVISHDARSVGFPADHPDMKQLLAAPVSFAGKTFGRVYLSDKMGGEPFNANDEVPLGSFAHSLSVVLANRQIEAERQVAEQQLREMNLTLESRIAERTAELQATNAELDAFAYSVSHDLRAPLRAMHGFASAILEDYAEKLDGEGREFCERIVGAANRVDRLIQDLLAYSRVGRLELQFQSIDLTEIIEDTLKQLKPEIEAKRAEITVHGSLPDVTGHRTTLLQIVENLLSNALKFVAEDVRPKVLIRTELRNGRVILWIEDNGIGILPEYWQQIFRVFERLHGIETYPGTGIGLATVRRAAESLGGSVGVESTPGEGSRFFVELPQTE